MQVRWVDQTQYPMIVVASLSAVPQSCRTPLPNQYLDCMLLAVHTHTLSLSFYTKHFLQQPTFTPTSFYTNQILHRKDLTQTNFLTNHLLRKPLCTPTNPCFGPVGQRPEGPAECRRLLNNYSHVFHVTL